MNAIATGIVGFGKIARERHAPAIASDARFELVAAVDPAAAPDGLPAYPTVGQMLAAHPRIAAVAVCTPPGARAGAAREAIASGRHVLLEKPPCATIAEATDLAGLARAAGVTLFTAWHSQQAAAVEAARARIAETTIRAVHVTWKEDVHVWHPGQAWLWQPSGFGVFDPGINALSILSTILPRPLRVVEAELEVPVDCATPVAARLTLEGVRGYPIEAEFDFRQAGPQTWDIVLETGEGVLRLSHGGNVLALDDVVLKGGEDAEYPALYSCFADLIGAGGSAVDLAPLRLAEQALRIARVKPAPALRADA